jgi:hypothetical protein
LNYFIKRTKTTQKIKNGQSNQRNQSIFFNPLIDFPLCCRSYCYPVVESEVMAELSAEDKAKKMKKKDLLVTDETEELSAGKNQGIH